MAITQQELGRRIRESREASRLTQEEVARHLGLSRPTVVQIEAGNRSVSSLELDKLAYLFGRDIREFVAESFAEQDVLATLFRAQPDLTEQPAVMERVRSCILLGREYTNLERLLGINRREASLGTHALPMPGNRWDAVQQGQHIAEEERRRLEIGYAPLPDLAELLESQGVRTGMVGLPDDVSGFTLSPQKVGLFVVVNSTHSTVRRRFSLAHEYGHVLLDRARIGFVSRATDRDDLIEVRANAFAAAFLMPEDGVREFIEGLGKGKPSRMYAEVFDEVASLDVEGRTEPGSQSIQLYDVVLLAHHFGTSRLAALYRLRNLRLLSEAEFDKLKRLDETGAGKHLAALLGSGVDSSEMPEREQPGTRSEFRYRFLTLALEAFRREEISRGKLKDLAAMVQLPAGDLDRLLEDLGLDDDAHASKGDQ
ncbi:MAG: ImmA/IrrE family metallo-endopeptidase [Acidobacteria bacterium]|nr:ImmA/IrrE family metallo-endopeptidase [Acidobacteriota bacterium]